MSSLPTGTITFLFTDIEGSTKRWEANPQAMQAAFSRQEAILRHAIETNAGYAYKMIGDAFQAAFPTAPQALQAAIDAQRALPSETWPAETGEVKVRMALHTGTTEERGDDYVGPTLNRVARLLSAAHGGQVLLTLATAELVRDSLPIEASLLDMGEHRLRDLTRPEHIFQLVVPDLPSQFPPLNTLDNRPNNLPLQPTPLIGRERELAEVEKMLGREDVRVVTLTGPGGTGKTRLGLQLASELLDDYPDGAWFVDLSPLTEGGLVVPTIASVLGVKEGGGGQPIIDTLKEYLKDKSTLLVLDNFEQVVGAAKEVSALIAVCPNLKVLATSRIPLHIRGEKEYHVPPLSVPDVRHLPPVERLSQYEAVRLFIERATDVKPDFEVTNENAPAVAEICVRLDGLPLAIELAAARIRMLPPQAILSRLENRLKLLTGGGRDLAERQQTLRGAIDWSYDLLSEGEKQLFRRMAPFSGGRTLEALEAVCNSDAANGAGPLPLDVLDGVDALLSNSLLQQREGSDGEPRFWMLETIHEYAKEKLQNSGEGEVLYREHALYYMRLAEVAAPHLKREDQVRWLERLDYEYDNMRAAFRWAKELGEAGDVEATETGLRLAIALERFWQVRVYAHEGFEQTMGLLAIGQLDGAIKARALNVAASLAEVRGDYVTEHSLLEESLHIWRELGDKENLVETLNNLGNVFHYQEDYANARALAEEALIIQEELGERKTSVHNLGVIAYEQGDYTSAGSLLEEALALETEAGDTRRVALAQTNLGLVAYQLGNYELALSRLKESLSIRQALGAKLGIVYTLEAMALVYGGLGKVEKAAHLWGVTQALRDAMGAPLPPNERTQYKRALEMARTQLGDEAFDRACAEGRTMTNEQAVAYAFEETIEGTLF